ncbi:MAG: hypothetical protein ACXAC7_22410, partial [Candidatus Hodarchaeales archaeon]
LLIITSSTLFVLVIVAFSKLVFFDHREDFGIVSLKSWRALFFFLLVVSFISAVYLLLDSALVNIYMITGPVDVIWGIEKFIIDLPVVTLNTDREAYSLIRSLWFFGFFVILLVFPIGMFFIILTRLGRTTLFEREHKDEEKKSVIKQLFIMALFLFTPIIEIFLLLILSTSPPPAIAIVVFLLAGILAIWWLFQLILLIWKTVKFSAWFSYANLLLIFPMILIFYVLPVLIWTAWDLILIYSKESLVDTIHELITYSDLKGSTSILSDFTAMEIFTSTLLYNATSLEAALPRIIQLDFVIIVGVSAMVIGLAEGYSIVAIFRALTRGASIARSGRIMKTSSPKMVVIASRLVMLGVWFGFLWDKFLVLYQFFVEEFDMPEIDFPRLFSYVIDFVDYLESFNDLFLALALMLVPLYFIITSSFKFLSVTLVVEKVKHDTQISFLLISSAFVLICTTILQDISAFFENSDSNQLAYMPFFFANDENLLPWASKVFENLEAAAFYGGVLIALVITLRGLTNYLIKRYRKEETPLTKIEDIQKETREPVAEPSEPVTEPQVTIPEPSESVLEPSEPIPEPSKPVPEPSEPTLEPDSNLFDEENGNTDF